MGLFERGYGLVIGVSEYSDPAWNVPIAERDADDLYQTLIDPQIGAYDRGRVKLLCGPQATRARIDEELRFLAVQTEPGDTVFISFTGHGALGEDGLYYLGSSDTQFTGEQCQICKNSGYSIAQLARALGTIRAERLLLVINACASGHLNNLAALGGLRSTVISEGEREDLLKSGRGRALITASRPDEQSHFRSDRHNSYFGRALVDGLRGVDVSSASGYVGLFDLYNAIYSQVQTEVAAAGYQQHPQINLVAGDGPFPVARYLGSQRGDLRLIQQTPPIGADVRVVQINIDRQYIDNSKQIDFGIGNQIGSITFRGDIAQGDIIKTYHGGQSADDDEDKQIDPLKELPKLQQRVAVANNVDKFARNNAAFQISQAVVALTEGDTTMAVQFIDQALPLLDAMNNGYINSAARKLRAVRAALA
ncbi:MAG: caspase family protein [Chloroflexales bacterium]